MTYALRMFRRYLCVLCLASLAATASAQPARDRHVALVSIDGFADDLLDDPTLAVPALRALAAKGVVAEGLVPVNPTVTWPNHTSMVTGVGPDRHTVLYNGWAVRGAEGAPVTIEPRVPKVDLVRGDTLYDIAHAAGLTTAEVDWVAIEGAPTITWSFPEWPRVDGTVEREMQGAGLVTADDITTFTKKPITQRDELWTVAGEHLIRAHKPNLLLFHLLTTDSVQHAYGAKGLAARTALELADTRLARLVEAYRAAGILDKTTFIVVSDHGFKTVKRVIRPNALFRQLGLETSAWAISEGGTAMVYATREAGKDATIARLTQALTGVEGVARVITPEQFAPLGFPQPSANPRMADVVLAAADGYAFQNAATGDVVADASSSATPGSHGYLNTERDMRAIFVASGAGVKAGVTVGDVRTIDIAPTIARLLGLTMTGATGRVLTDALR